MDKFQSWLVPKACNRDLVIFKQKCLYNLKFLLYKKCACMRYMCPFMSELSVSHAAVSLNHII